MYKKLHTFRSQMKIEMIGNIFRIDKETWTAYAKKVLFCFTWTLHLFNCGLCFVLPKWFSKVSPTAMKIFHTCKVRNWLMCNMTQIHCSLKCLLNQCRKKGNKWANICFKILFPFIENLVVWIWRIKWVWPWSCGNYSCVEPYEHFWK
jgi:hypothetical protein